MKKTAITLLFICFSILAFSQNNHFKILAIGDSNGEFDFGWVAQLQKIRPGYKIINTSVSGNTIGFDNLEKKELNTLRNVDSFLNKGFDELKELDAIVIMLGTNDCKAVFADSLKIVPENLKILISRIKSNSVYHQFKPTIFIVSPPPFGPEEMLIEKYAGGAKRIKYLQHKFKKVAQKESCIFIDTYSEIKDIFKNITSDGIHLTPEGQKIIASIIHKKLEINLQ